MPFGRKTVDAGTGRVLESSVALRSNADRATCTGTQEAEREEYFLPSISKDKHSEARVSPPDDYDVIAALQASPSLATGLGETPRHAIAGCDSLGTEKTPVPHLRSGIRRGIVPNQRLLKCSRVRHIPDVSLHGPCTIRELVMAQGVFSRTQACLLRLALGSICPALATVGKQFAPRVDGTRETQGKGRFHRGAQQYSEKESKGHLRDSDLAAKHPAWSPPGLLWFVATKPWDEAGIEALAGAARDPRPGWIQRRPSRRQKFEEEA